MSFILTHHNLEVIAAGMRSRRPLSGLLPPVERAACSAVSRSRRSVEGSVELSCRLGAVRYVSTILLLEMCSSEIGRRGAS
eukprot:4073352-Amphidinium_carterae.1